MKKDNIILGIILMVVGVLFLGSNLDWWNIDLFFDGWWTLFIIIPALVGIFKKEERISSIIGFIIGVLLLLAAQDVINWGMIWKIFMPVLLIIFGISLVFSTKKKENKQIVSKYAKRYLAIFSGVDEKIKDDIDDISLIAVLGGIELDFRDAKFTKDITIACTCVFGGIDLRLPENVKVEVDGLSLFGDVTNKHIQKDKKEYTVHIEHTTIFGGIDLI